MLMLSLLFWAQAEATAPFCFEQIMSKISIYEQLIHDQVVAAQGHIMIVAP